MGTIKIATIVPSQSQRRDIALRQQGLGSNLLALMSNVRVQKDRKARAKRGHIKYARDLYPD